MMSGVACKLDSVGFFALCNATKEVIGHVSPYSITGSLPCIRELQVRSCLLPSLVRKILTWIWLRRAFVPSECLRYLELA